MSYCAITNQEIYQRLLLIEKKVDMILFARTSSSLWENFNNALYNHFNDWNYNNVKINNTSCFDSGIDTNIVSINKLDNSFISNENITKVDDSYRNETFVDDNFLTSNLTNNLQNTKENKFKDSKLDSNNNVNKKKIFAKTKNFLCEICKKTFNRNWLLVSHKRIHSGERPFHCNVCDKKFSDRSNYRAHCQIHTEKSFVCEKCGKHFALKTYLKKHQKLLCDKNLKKLDSFKSFSISSNKEELGLNSDINSNITSSFAPNFSSTPIVTHLQNTTPNADGFYQNDDVNIKNVNQTKELIFSTDTVERNNYIMPKKKLTNLHQLEMSTTSSMSNVLPFFVDKIIN